MATIVGDGLMKKVEENMLFTVGQMELVLLKSQTH